MATRVCGFGAEYPQVGGAGVEVYVEDLGGCTNAYGRQELGLLKNSRSAEVKQWISEGNYRPDAQAAPARIKNHKSRENTHVGFVRGSSNTALARSPHEAPRGCSTILEVGLEECAGAIADVVWIGHLLH